MLHFLLPPPSVLLGETLEEEEFAASLLSKYRCRLTELPVDLQALQRSLEATAGITAEQREVSIILSLSITAVKPLTSFFVCKTYDSIFDLCS